MTDETSRYRWPVPAWNADWQQWQGVFRDLATNIDSTVFSSVDGNRFMFESLPSASIVSNGPGYNLSMNGPLVIRSRTHSVSITVPVGVTALTANSVLALTVTPGAVGAQSIEWDTFSSGIGSSPDIVPFGYVDDSYNITWWNGARLTAGGSALPLFGYAPGGGSGDVTKVGTPVNNQVGVWTGDGTIEGDANLTFNGSDLVVGGNITVGGTVDGIDVANDVAANTAKITNATHTGDVTGSEALSIASGAVDIANLSASGTPSASTFLRGDNTWATVSGGGTLDDAYDYGGAGSGRTITADSGAVVITNAVSDATNVLELERDTGTGNVLSIQHDNGGYPTSTGRKAVFLTAASPAPQTIWSDQELYIGTSEPVLGMYLQNRGTGGALLRMQAQAITTGDAVMWVTSDGASADDSTGYLLLQAAGAGTGAESKIEIRATAGSTGPGVVDIFASGGSAYVKIGGANCDVRLNDDNRAGSSWTGQEFIQLSASSAEWDTLETNCSGEVSLINAINQAYAAGGGAPVTLAASAVTGGLSLLVQELGFQASGPGTLVPAVEADLGDPAAVSDVHPSAIWADDTWWTGSTSQGGRLYEHTSGTSWTEHENTLAYDAGYGYESLVDFGGEIWCGAIGTTHSVYSYDPTLDAWTGRGKPGSDLVTSLCLHDGAIHAGDWDGYVYAHSAVSTWTSLGIPWSTTNPRCLQILSSGGELYAVIDGSFGTRVCQYVSGTTWTVLSYPVTIGVMADWDGTLVVSGLNGLTRPEVYKYESGTGWTRLGSELTASNAPISLLAADSNGDLHAVPGGTNTNVYKYDVGTDSWVVADTTATGGGTRGEFNGDDVLVRPGANAVRTWKGSYSTPVNGYLAGSDWVAFSDKVANVTHTGEVTGGSVTTLDKTAVTNKSIVTADGADYVLISDTSDSGSLKKVLASDFGGGGDMTWQRLSVAGPTTATTGNGYMIDAGANAVTLNLPATPTEGDIVGVQAYDASNAVTIGRNGSTIEGGTTDLLLTRGEAYTFVYAEATEGWVRVAASDGRIKTSFENTTVTLDTFVDTNDGAAKYDYFISSGGNMRTGTVRIVWDASADDVEKDESSTADIGDTSNFSFDADISSNMVRLRATATGAGAYLVRLVKTAI